jgi:CheY-like chemotaxis protein
LGIDAYLMKPVGQSELLVTMLDVMSRRCKHASSRRSSAADEGDERPSFPGTGLRILLAEDNAVNQLLAERLLVKQGHTVITASSGREALEAHNRTSFDLILMDVQMPEMDGLEATSIIRAREVETGAHVPIVAITAHALNGDRERFLAAGMDDYVSKPITLHNLSEAIERVVRSSNFVSQSPVTM